MKKHNTLRIAALLLVLVMVTTCAVSGTFAKYVTSTSATDNARVAYWGWQETTLSFDLFDGVYSTDVNSEGDPGDNVVAPGTAKEESFNFKYVDNTAKSVTAPEVDYTFEIALTATGNYTTLDTNKNFVWTLTLPGGTKTSYQTVSALETALESLNKTGDQYYEAGALPTGFDAGNNTITIGWEWLFAEDADAETSNEYTVGEDTLSQDEYDTMMGNATNLDNVTFTITITATQVNAA